MVRKASVVAVVLAATLVVVGGAHAAVHSNSGAITINTSTIASGQAIVAATPYPSTIDVAGEIGLIADVDVTLNGFWQAGTEDVNVLLVAPAGQSVLLLSDVGETGPSSHIIPSASPVNLTFDDSAAGTVPSEFGGGSYKPTDLAEDCPLTPTGDTFPSPAPAGPYGTALSSLIGTAPNGTWSLYVIDDCRTGDGAITGGWSLTIATTTAAQVSSFAAARAGKAVAVRWRTGSERGILGFHVWRSRGNGPARRITRSLVAAKGGLGGARYGVTDRTARRGVLYTYRLQAVYLDGSRSWFGSVRLRS